MGRSVRRGHVVVLTKDGSWVEKCDPDKYLAQRGDDTVEVYRCNDVFYFRTQVVSPETATHVVAPLLDAFDNALILFDPDAEEAQD
eukprot:7791809-Alexandrium_andersonii.AAC.1